MKTKTIRSSSGRLLTLPVTVYQLARSLADKYVVSLEAVLFGHVVGRRPSKSVAHARHELWARTMDDNPSMSYPEAARLFGITAHASIIRGRREYYARTGRLM